MGNFCLEGKDLVITSKFNTKWRGSQGFDEGAVSGSELQMWILLWGDFQDWKAQPSSLVLLRATSSSDSDRTEKHKNRSFSSKKMFFHSGKDIQEPMVKKS